MNDLVSKLIQQVSLSAYLAGGKTCRLLKVLLQSQLLLSGCLRTLTSSHLCYLAVPPGLGTSESHFLNTRSPDWHEMSSWGWRDALGVSQTTLCNTGSWEELALGPGCRGRGVTTIVPKINGNTGFKFRWRITPVLLKYFTRASKLDIITNKIKLLPSLGFFPPSIKKFSYLEGKSLHHGFFLY